MSRVDVIANERLLDGRHNLHEIQDFWQDGPVALVFLQQFGSAFALQQVKELSARHGEITADGGNVVFIGIGTPLNGYTLAKRAATRFPVLTTTDRTLYRTMGLHRTRGSIVPLLSATVPLVDLMRAGTWPYQPTGDWRQLGGAFVATQGGRTVVWDLQARRPTDLASADSIVNSLRRAHALTPQSHGRSAP